MRKIPVGKTIAFAYAFTFGHLRTVVGLTWVVCAVTTALTAAMEMYYDARMVAFMRSENPGELGLTILIGLVGFAAVVLASAIPAVAITQQALGLRDRSGTRLYLSFGIDEWRVFSALVRGILFVAGIFVLLVFLLGLFEVIAGVILQGGSQPAGAASPMSTLFGVLVGVGGGLGAIYTIVRITFLQVPVVVAGAAREPLRATWMLGAGNVFRMLVVMVAAVFPMALVQLQVSYLLGGKEIFGAFDTGTTVEQLEAQIQQMRSGLVIDLLTRFVIAMPTTALIYAAQAFAWRALVPVENEASSEVTPPP